MVLKALECLNNYAHGSPFVILPVQYYALIFKYFRKAVDLYTTQNMELSEVIQLGTIF